MMTTHRIAPYIQLMAFILGGLLGILSTASCSRSELSVPGPDGEWAPLEDFTLTYQVTSPTVITKAAQNTTIENTVHNLFVILFDTDGKTLRSRKYLVAAAERDDRYDDVINVFTVKEAENGTISQGVIPDFFSDFSDPLTSGEYTFCAIANYSEDLKSNLESVLHLDHPSYPKASLKNIVDNSCTGGVVERNFFLMSAEKKVTFETHIHPDGVSYKVTDVILDLKRVDAKITFNVTADIPDAADLSFTDVSYKVHNVPSLTYLLGREKGASTVTNSWDAAYSTDIPADNFSCMNGDNSQLPDKAYNTGCSFTFYMSESRPLVENPIPASLPSGKSYSSLYAMREAWDYSDTGNPNSAGASVHDRTFTYAPPTATFVEINGILAYKRPDPEDNSQMQEVYADVTYIVHLGETGAASDANNHTLVNNYDVRRNVHYTYNINITGISSYTAEVDVNSPEEARPGAEGDVYIADGCHIESDAHYSTYLIKLDPAALAGSAGWSVKTPFGSASYSPAPGGDVITGDCMDYKWVLFAINRHFGETSADQTVKFPGVQAYDGGLDFSGQAASDVGNSFENGRKFSEIITTDNYYYGKELDDDACLRDVHQLLRYLSQEYAKYENHRSDPSAEGSSLIDENTREIAITAFVDEYSYIHNPRVDKYVHPATPVSEITADAGDQARRLALWKTFTNAPDRIMSIIPASTAVSPDGNTSLTSSHITLSQKSIKSIYNTASASVVSGWGMEAVNETGPLPNSIDNPAALAGPYTNTSDNGRVNTLNFFSDASGNPKYTWSELTATNASGNPFHACISRNRDLNGNDLIDENEIIWYLAARDQITGMWIAQPALDESLWLMKAGEYLTAGPRHYITSSIFDPSNTSSDIHKNMYVVWAEEGCTLGSSEDDEATVNNSYAYRCVRNLGLDVESADAPAAYASITPDKIPSTDPITLDREYYIVSLDGINVRALRSVSDAVSLPFDDEMSINNRPYASFDVFSENEPGPSGYAQVNVAQLYDELSHNVSHCPSGWRIPNQREMLLMMSFIGDGDFSMATESDQVAVATSFSYAGTGTYYGTGSNIFFFDNGNGNFSLRLHDGTDSRRVQIRCIRDHTDTEVTGGAL